MIKSSAVVQAFPPQSHKPIVYPAAVVAASQQKDAAKAFLDFLGTESAGQVFEKYGVDVLAE